MAVDASHRELMYQSDEIRFQTAYGSGMTDLFPANSGLTLASNGLPLSRKRSRDCSSFSFNPNAPVINPNAFEFLAEDMIGSQIYQQQFEIDRFIAQHSNKMRREMEEIRRQNSMRLILLYDGLMNKLKAKEEQIMKIGLVNQSLEEKVKSMSLENQIWRELAETNEATANALRDSLNQLMEQQQQEEEEQRIDDAESRCDGGGGGGERRRWCRRCGKEEASVLLLPCRHLCVCSLCVSAISSCPVCNCTKSAGVQVNMS